MSESRPTMTPREAAVYLGVSIDTIERCFRAGLIAGYRQTPTPRGRIRLYRDAVEEFDRQRKSQAPTEG